MPEVLLVFSLYVSIFTHYLIDFVKTTARLSLSLWSLLLCVTASLANGMDAPRLYIAPSHDALDWNAPAPPITAMPLRQAIAQALPGSAASLPLAVSHPAQEQAVTLPGGLSRKSALERLLPPGTVLLVFESHVLLTAGKLLVNTPSAPTAAFQAIQPAQATSTPDTASLGSNFGVTTADRSLRGALERWSRQAGWTFESTFWTLPRDLPILASSQFGSDYKLAVTALIKSSESTDIPAKPCFYSNRVLRVVARADACTRATATPNSP